MCAKWLEIINNWLSINTHTKLIFIKLFILLLYYTYTKKENPLKIVVFFEERNRNCAFLVLINTYKN
jgi:hypothetical protein